MNDEREFSEITEVEADIDTPQTSGVPTIPQLCVALSILVVILGSPHAISFWKSLNIEKSDAQVVTPELAEAPTFHEDPFKDIALEARAAYVWDIQEQRPLYAKNAHAQLPLASLTKLMTGLVAHETYAQDERVKITMDAIQQDGENGFHDGDTWRMQDLLDYTMITSSNDGAYALAAAVGAAGEDGADRFIALMNERARALGLTQTYFTNPTGLDETEAESGSYGSARDMAFLMEHIVKNAPAVVAGTTEPVASFRDEGGTPYTATNTNQSISGVHSALGSKTGYTTLAGGNLVVAFDAGLNHPVVVAVLGSSREGRFQDIETLIERTKTALSIAP